MPTRLNNKLALKILEYRIKKALKINAIELFFIEQPYTRNNRKVIVVGIKGTDIDQTEFSSYGFISSVTSDKILSFAINEKTKMTWARLFRFLEKKIRKGFNFKVLGREIFMPGDSLEKIMIEMDLDTKNF